MDGLPKTADLFVLNHVLLTADNVTLWACA